MQMRPLCLRHRNPLASSLFSNSTFIMPARQNELHWTLKYIHKFTGCTQVKFLQIHSLASTFVASAIILAPLQGAGTADSLPVFTVIIAGLRLVRVGSSADSVSVCRHGLQRATAKLCRRLASGRAAHHCAKRASENDQEVINQSLGHTKNH